ncbi:hypothetical protein PSH90_27220 [Pseudomonas sp. FP1762]|uniref:hypothetical protein n=1 Tax=Pseudomonas sp. FP1762 TaxID=2954080 RepID=UPI002734F48A|nr:hypothetical protein [Pseudomonas sp. FP1762]WLG62494.1 hypothetical protein PSH90_27220 [Pseudomonas sp. FP1762]
MNPSKSIGPSFFTHPTGHLPAADEQVKPSARPSGPRGPRVPQTHFQSFPPHISRGARTPIKVGSFKLPKGLSKNRLASLLKPLGPVTEPDANDSRDSSEDGDTYHRYRALDPADDTDKPAREVEVTILVSKNGQLKKLIASLHPERGDEARPDGIEVDFVVVN